MYELKALNIFKRYVAYIHNQIFYKVIFFSITKSSSFLSKYHAYEFTCLTYSLHMFIYTIVYSL